MAGFELRTSSFESDRQAKCVWNQSSFLYGQNDEYDIRQILCNHTHTKYEYEFFDYDYKLFVIIQRTQSVSYFNRRTLIDRISS